MRIFNEEVTRGTGKADTILITRPREIVILIEALECACEARPRKKTWKGMLNELTTKACVYY